MRLRDSDGWSRCVEANSDYYGVTAVSVAARTMDKLDAAGDEFDATDLLLDANREMGADLSLFMVQRVVRMVSKYHERGDEFEMSWSRNWGAAR